jgi:phosphoglycolate phosphatase
MMPGAAVTLALFDIDGTLVREGATPGHLEAVRAAAQSAFGAAAPSALWTAGKTDLQIAAEILCHAGLPAATALALDGSRFCAEAARRFSELCPTDLADQVIPGIASLLGELQGRGDVRLGLVTGCTRAIARIKLTAAGLDRFFPGEVGGFGCDHADRRRLVPIARRRARSGQSPPWPRRRTIVIGDTPADIDCAHADGVRCVAFAPGHCAVPSDLSAAERCALDAVALRAAIDSEVRLAAAAGDGLLLPGGRDVS